MQEVIMLTIKETAKRSGLAEHAVRKMVLENKVVFIKSGNKYLINWNKFVEHLNEGEKIEEENHGFSIPKIRKVN